MTRFSTANIMARPQMAQAQVLADVRRMAHVSGVIGWQEIRLDRYKDAIGSLEGFKTVYPTEGTGECPISWRNDLFRLISSGTSFLHDSSPRVTPDRWINWAQLEYRHRPGARFVFTNRHYVSKAWSLEHGVPQAGLRRRLWEEGMVRDVALLEGFVKRGLPVVMVGDYNKAGTDVMPDRVLNRRVVTGINHGLDHVLFLHGRDFTWEVRKSSRRSIELHSDHDGIWVAAQFRRRQQ